MLRTVVAGRFEIESLAGRGGMGAVYRATDRETGGIAAVKILHDSAPFDHRERLAREGRLLAELTHPSFVKYLAFGEAEGRPFLAMEWLEGEDLATRLRRTGVNANEATAIAMRVAAALGVAHARNVIHRDIKPSNLFLVERDPARVKVLDFGIARIAAADMTRTGATIGTPRYMAPEQARGSRDLDARADVFSLGCVLFECLCGRPPFTGADAAAVFAKILLDQAPQIRTLRDDLPPALEELVDRMLAKDPARRPRDGGEVAAGLEAIQVDELNDSQRRIVPGRMSAVTGGEQRLVSVVFAANVIERSSVPDGDARIDLSVTPQPSRDTVVDIEATYTVGPGAKGAGPLRALSTAIAAHRGRGEVLADGSLVVTLLGQAAATDQAALAARCALAIRAIIPTVPMALAIGRSNVVGHRVLVGDLIDRATELVRAPRVSPGDRDAGDRGDARESQPNLRESQRKLSAEGREQPNLRDGRESQPNLRERPSLRYAIRVDDVSAGLLDGRFAIEGDANGLCLTRERDAGSATRTLLGKPVPCVGRERELAALGAIWQECVGEPMAHLVLVTAVAGIGKSRLRLELSGRLARDGAEVWIGRGDPMSAGAPFALLAEALRRAAGIVDDEPPFVRHRRLRARVSRHVSDEDAPRVTEFLGELVGAALPLDEGSVQLRAARKDPQLMGDQMLRACEDFFAAECRARPVLLVLEDLQWGDRPTVSFVDALVRRLADLPLMVLALARPDVDAVFPRLWSERHVERIHLAELTRRAAEKLVREALGADVDPEIVNRLVERAAGNAFYLEELIRSVAEGHGERLPETVVAMAQVRIENLEADARHVLRAASIFGQVFWRGGVAALLEGGETQAHDWLAELARRELITARRTSRFGEEAEYTFRHSLVREAAYAMLTERDRLVGHALAGAWLEMRARDGDGDVDALALGEHFQRGGEPRRAVAWYRQAAEHALEGDDLAGAIERADRAIACLRPDGAETNAGPYNDPAGRSDAPSSGSSTAPAGDAVLVGTLRQLQAGAHAWRGEWPLAAERGTEALGRLDRGSVPWLAAAAAVADACTRMLEHDRVIALCHDFAAMHPVETSGATGGDAEAMRGDTATGGGAEAMRADSATAPSDPTGDATAMGGAARIGGSTAAAASSASDRSRDVRVTGVATVTTGAYVEPEAFRAYTHAVAMTMTTLLWHGEPELTEQLFARLDAVEAAIGQSDPAALAWIHNARAWRALRDGDPAESLVLDQKVEECFRIVGDRRNGCRQRANVGYGELMLGDFAAAERSLRDAAELAIQVGLHQVTAAAQHNLGLALARLGRIDEGRTVERAALAAFEAQGNRRLAAAAHNYLALIEIAAGDATAALRHAVDAVGAAPDKPGTLCGYRATRSIAYRLAGDHAAALREATAAIDLIAAYGRPEEGEATVRLAYAEALHATGAVADARRAITDAAEHVHAAASKIRDPERRSRFLDAVVDNVQTLALARAWST